MNLNVLENAVKLVRTGRVKIDIITDNAIHLKVNSWKETYGVAIKKNGGIWSSCECPHAGVKPMNTCKHKLAAFFYVMQNLDFIKKLTEIQVSGNQELFDQFLEGEG